MFVMPLSEKAKGKQRAFPLSSSIASTTSQSTSTADVEQLSRDLVVRFTDGLPDLIIIVEKEDLVKDVKRKVSLLLRLFMSTQSRS